MANSKVQLSDGTVLIDLTNTTVSPNSMTKGTTAVDKTGTFITGTLVIQQYDLGSTVPSDSVGNDGDVFLRT